MESWVRHGGGERAVDGECSGVLASGTEGDGDAWSRDETGAGRPNLSMLLLSTEVAGTSRVDEDRMYGV